jgi:hypothetical protein
MRIYLETQIDEDQDDNNKEKYHAETEYNPFASNNP